jgi:hypothetical protein
MEILTAQGPLEVAPAGLGHNHPPVTPYEAIKAHIDDLDMEARNYLDGEPIANEEQAKAVSKLLDDARKAKSAAEEQRKIEAKPFDDGKAEVQARYNPLCKDKTGKCDLIAETCKQVLAPWLQKIDDEQKAEAKRLADEAEAKRAEAAVALQAASGNLSAREEAEDLLKAADTAEKAATSASKAKAHAKGGERAVGLRDVYTPVLVKPIDALRHYMIEQSDPLKAWLLDQANRDVRAGKRAIPGFEIQHERVAR